MIFADRSTLLMAVAGSASLGRVVSRCVRRRRPAMSKAVFASLLVALSVAGCRRSGKDPIQTRNLCSVLRGARWGEEKEVEVSGIYVSALEDAYIYGAECRQLGDVCVQFDSKLSSPDFERAVATLPRSSSGLPVVFRGTFHGPLKIEHYSENPKVHGVDYYCAGQEKTMLLVKEIESFGDR